MHRKVGIVSLGCAKNQVDTEVMLGILTNRGYEIVNQSEKADILIVNTCGFIGPAKEESIQAILEQAKYKKYGNCKTLIVTGCLAQRYSDELMEEIPEVDAIVGTGNYSRIAEVLEKANKERSIAYLDNLSSPEKDGLPRMLSTGGVSAYLKIAEGCNNYCTYCIIPKLRGRFRSRPVSSVVKEANSLVQGGVRELIIVAQDITGYGQDSDGEYDLVLLLKQLCQIPDLKWIRLMYCYPDRITEELIELIAGEDKICNYLDIPVQHINQRILSRMNRVSDSKQIRSLLDMIKERIPDIVLRTSLIVGFPGERETEFQELMDFVEEGYFQHIGVFPYSREEGTRAAGFPDQVEESIKEERKNRLMSVQKRISKRLLRIRQGQKCDVQIEGRESEELYYGRSYGEAPEVDGKVYVHSTSPLMTGDFIRVKITKVFDYDLLGEVYESGE
ncbi:MAG: 30S ribosomal protein S12 methylthiotransferase RimO [Caldicoprobacterales bacterium]|nr:30S ribosomal protein S12 methylthiotransferase RimO [Clostridiales bacterium]